eukprot:9339167-Pyramimonas_sp.AAC.1
MKIAELQVSRGRFFALEHPASASSWKLESTRHILGLPGVSRETLDQCMHGLSVDGEGLSKKPTSIMSNSPPLLAHCRRRCSGDHSR